MPNAMTATPRLDRLQRAFTGVIAIGAFVAVVGGVVAGLLPAHDLPLTLVISALGIWLAAMGVWGRKKISRVRGSRPRSNERIGDEHRRE
jgi:hypothetical protein